MGTHTDPKPRTGLRIRTPENHDDSLCPPVPTIHSMGPRLYDPVWALEEHRTPRCELLHVLSGHLRLHVDGHCYQAAPGETLIVPANVTHRDEFDLDEGLEVFMVFFTLDDQNRFLDAVMCDRLCSVPESVRWEISSVFEQIRADLGAGTPVDRLVAEARVCHILALLLRAAFQDDATADSEDFGERRRNRIMLQANVYLEEHYSDPITLDGIAAELQISPFYLSHVFSQESEFSLFAHLAHIRLRHAMELLRSGDLTVAEIAHKVGYSTPGYFSKVFKKHYGHSPKNYLATLPPPSSPAQP